MKLYLDSIKKLFLISQVQHFSTEIANLSEGKPISKTSKIYNSDPFIDDKGLMRVRGRIQNTVAWDSLLTSTIHNSQINE